MGQASKLKWKNMLSVNCPNCGQTTSQLCIDPNGKEVRYVHPERFELYEQAEKAKATGK